MRAYFVHPSMNATKGKGKEKETWGYDLTESRKGGKV